MSGPRLCLFTYPLSSLLSSIFLDADAAHCRSRQQEPLATVLSGSLRSAGTSQFVSQDVLKRSVAEGSWTSRLLNKLQRLAVESLKVNLKLRSAHKHCALLCSIKLENLEWHSLFKRQVDSQTPSNSWEPLGRLHST